MHDITSFETGGATLFNTVAQNVLPRIVECTVDLVLTDPPYIISRDSGFSSGGDARFHTYQTDFGAWDRDEFTIEDLDHIVQGLYRVLRDGGVAIVFFDIWKVSDLAKIMTDAGFQDVTMIEWLKTNPVPINSRKNYLSNAREIAVVASKPGARSSDFQSQTA